MDPLSIAVAITLYVIGAVFWGMWRTVQIVAFCVSWGFDKLRWSLWRWQLNRRIARI